MPILLNHENDEIQTMVTFKHLVSMIVENVVPHTDPSGHFLSLQTTDQLDLYSYDQETVETALELLASGIH